MAERGTDRAPRPRPKSRGKGGSAIGKLLKGVLLRATELLFAVGLVIVFFLVILGVYAISFPEGASISDLFSRQDPGASDWSTPRIVLESDESLVDDPLFRARLSRVLRKVKDKPDGGIAWGDSDSGMLLGDRHAVQSFSDSGAVITFDDRSNLQMGENSLVVIKNTKRVGKTRQRVANLVVLEGELSGRVEGYQEDPMRVDVVTANATVRMDSETDKPVDFAITTERDEPATYTIFEGVAEIRTENEVLNVGPEESITIDADGVISRPQPLLATPESLGPPDGFTAYFRTAPPLITFQWRASEQADAYHFELARDSDFNQVVHHEMVTTPEFVHGHLKPGHYYWRVTSLARTTRSEPSIPMGVVIERDRQPPALRVQFPEETVTVPVLELVGEVKPGVDVFVVNQRVEVQPDGRFVYSLRLQQGFNVVVVEAVDLAGNVAYESQLVHATYLVEEIQP